MLDDMEEALRLTRAGRTSEATALIQTALGRSGTHAKDDRANAMPRGRIEIDGDVVKPKSDRVKPKAEPAGDRTEPAFADVAPKRRASMFGHRTADSAFLRPRAAVRARVKRSGAEPAIAKGARWEWQSHAGAGGSRRYRLYVPANASTAPMPLVLMLHGCTQNPDDFAAGTRILAAAEARQFLIALPEQTNGANAMACWNWFDPNHQGMRGEPALLAGIVGDVASAESVDRSRIVAAGLSAGGAMAAILGEAYPDLFAGIGVHAGLPAGAARDLPSAQAAMRQGPGRVVERQLGAARPPRLFSLHGEADRTVSPRNADALLDQLRPLAETTSEAVDGSARVTRLHADGGRTIAEDWRVAGLGHAWSGGAAGASYTAPEGPDATGLMLDFLLDA